jgi:heme-degrading monooxygenase HmoA
MKRRTCFGVLLAVAASSSANASTGKPTIQLHCDLAVDPKKEQEFIQYFQTVFRPVARKHQGFIDIKLLKLNTAVRGGVPPGGKFRFELAYESEDPRQKWIASDDHAKAWPPMENILTDKNFGILVYDVY